MNSKLVLGIVLPLILILSLVILSVSNIGFSLEKQTVDSVQFDSLFIDYIYLAPQDYIPVQTITITNDFFLPRKYELPKLVGCVYDKEGITDPRMLYVKYEEGSYTRGSDVPTFGGIVFDFDRSLPRRGVELPARSKKQVRILLEPEDYHGGLDPYRGYDEVLLVELKDSNSYYSYCQDLESKDIESATHIPIVE